MSLVNGLRQCQLEIRLIQNQLQAITVEEKAHPGKAKPGDSHEKTVAWYETKKLFEKRRKLLKERLAELQEERQNLEHALDHSPLTRATLGHVINQLLEIEIKFTAETWGDAWESLSAFIDWLEKEEQKAAAPPALKAVA